MSDAVMVPEACAAMPAEVLRAYLMDPCAAKSEAEHWAARRITELEAMLAASPSVGGWEDMAGTGAFLLDRLADFERTVESESGDAAVNDWHGHVVPAIARFRSSLSAPPPVSTGSRPQEAILPQTEKGS